MARRRKSSDDTARRWPPLDYYAALRPDDSERVHPVDALIEAAPPIRKHQQRLRRLQQSIAVPPGSEKELRDALDAATEVAYEREKLAFNLGAGLGALATREEQSRLLPNRSSGSAKALRRSILGLLLDADVPPREQLGALLAAAYALGTGPLNAHHVVGETRARLAPPRGQSRRARRQRLRRVVPSNG
jgi:hypothetical protein